MDATIHIYTYKEGLLSKLAHDLRLTLSRFEVAVRGTEISGRFEPQSLRVDGSVQRGKLDRDELSASDREKIRDHLERDVLRVREFPEVRFVGHTSAREPPFSIRGELTLCGVSRPLELLLTLDRDRLLGELELVPSRWGIKPFRALGGALRVQDRIRVTIQASAEWLVAGGELNPAVKLTWSAASARPSSLKPSLSS